MVDEKYRWPIVKPQEEEWSYTTDYADTVVEYTHYTVSRRKFCDYQSVRVEGSIDDDPSFITRLLGA